MLTKGDEYPIHQTADPIAFSGTDRNFYDRYFFNGYSSDGSLFFAVAFGVYPHLNIMDGAFCVVHEGVQHNLHVSRHLGMERMDTVVGPLAIEVVEPLKKLRVRLAENEHGISADIVFEHRAVVIQEPRFTRRIGPRMFMDYTRMTQNGDYSGWIQINGKRIEFSPLSSVRGTRDRSWGVRPIGLGDPQEPVPPTPFQFCWLWAPLNFDDRVTLFHLNADAYGVPWNTAAVVSGLGESEPEHIQECHADLSFMPGSRHARAATLRFNHQRGGQTLIELTPHWQFYMSGMGYGNPEWGHGHNKGPLAIGYDHYRIDDITSYAPPYLHIQAFVTAKMTLPDGSQKHGCGVLEQMVIGPYSPWGLQDILDPAP